MQSWHENKEDFFTLQELQGLCKTTKQLAEFALQQYELTRSEAAALIVHKLNCFRRVDEVVINPSDIKDLDDKGIPYNPDDFDKADPIFFLDEVWFCFLTEYPETSQPVNVKHFRKSEFTKGMRQFRDFLQDADKQKLDAIFYPVLK